MSTATANTVEEAAAGTGSQTWLLDFTLNGERRQVEIDPSITLLELLRMKLGLTGTKGACLEGECGSCTVLVDGKPMNSCLILAAQMQGREVTTIEGLARGAKLHPLQRKFIEHGAVQCGYCTPGLIMTAKDILDRKPGCTEEEFLRALEGNLCRCTGYNKILGAVRDASREQQSE